jgi:hypothetical protein
VNLINRSGVSERIDAWHAAMDLVAASRGDRAGIVGYGVAELWDEDRRTKLLVPFGNTITDAGDLYNAGKIVAGIGPLAPSAPTAANGMKLGTSTTPVNKGAGTGINLAAYLTASNVSFDSGYATTANLGVNLGVNSVYRSTWAAGVATSATINEVVIVNDSATNATSTAANTYSRSVFSSTINKAAADTLQVTWNWKQLGT